MTPLVSPLLPKGKVASGKCIHKQRKSYIFLLTASIEVEVQTDTLWLSLRLRLTSVSQVDVCFLILQQNTLLDANDGVDEIVEEQRPFALKHGVSFGDLYESKHFGAIQRN